MYQFFGGFVFIIVNVVPPARAHCLAGFEGQAGAYVLCSGIARKVFPGEVPFENLDVFAFDWVTVVVVSYKAARL